MKWLVKNLLLVVVGLALASCGINLFESIAPGKDEKKAKIEEARVKMDEKDYSGAKEILTPLQEDADKDSNEVRLLLAAAILGDTGLDIWSIVSKLLDTSSSKASSSSASSGDGVDAILNAFSDGLLGTGAERERKFAGLSQALALLRTAPTEGDKKVENTACFFAAILVVPTVTDTKTQLAAATSALAAISSGTDGITCPNINGLLEPVNSLATLALNFSQTIAAAANCSFLNFGDTAATLNAVEERLKKLKVNADKGCVIPTCPAAVPDCNALFPECVQAALGVGSGASGVDDGNISACELTLHCTPLSKCFD